jgi:hypothetical protein
MRNIIDMAIEREAALLDAIIESPELVDGPVYPWTPTRTRLNPMTRKFSSRGARRARFTNATESRPRYLT